MKRIVFLFLLVGTFIFGCLPCDGPTCPHVAPPPPVSDDASASRDAGTTEACDSLCACACLDWRRFKCPEGEPTDAGVSCLDTCVLRSTLVRTASAQSSCWSNAKTVTALRACGGIRCIQ